jgi:hypothetical protein
MLRGLPFLSEKNSIFAEDLKEVQSYDEET